MKFVLAHHEYFALRRLINQKENNFDVWGGNRGLPCQLKVDKFKSRYLLNENIHQICLKSDVITAPVCITVLHSFTVRYTWWLRTLDAIDLVIFLCCSISVVLIYNPGISKFLTMMFLLSPHLCSIIGCICLIYLFPVRIHGWVRRPSHGLNKYMCTWELILVLFVRLFDLRLFGFVCSSSSWYLGRATDCDCSTPWTFFWPFFHYGSWGRGLESRKASLRIQYGLKYYF